MSSLSFARPDNCFPPAGTMCVDCGCCKANIYAGDDPLCWACDAGSHGPKKEESHAKLPTFSSTSAKVAAPVAAPQPEKRAAIPHVLKEAPIQTEEKSMIRKRVSDEVRAAIQNAPKSVRNTELQEKYNLSSATVSVIRRGINWNGDKASHVTGGGKPVKIRKVRAPKPPKPQQAIERTSTLRVFSVTDGCNITIAGQVTPAGADAFWAILSMEQKTQIIQASIRSILGAGQEG